MNEYELNKCPYCEKEQKQSRLYDDQHSVVTAMLSESYYDEAGRRHWHDGNWRVRGYTCSNGHRFSVRWRPPCPQMDFGGEREVGELEL